MALGQPALNLLGEPELDPAERMSRDALQALQRDRLRASLSRAYEKVPHYRASFDKAGVHPSDLNDLSDLSKFPFLVKTDLRDNYPFGLFAEPQEKLLRLHASSGTTGKPIVVGYTRNDLDVWAEVMARSLRLAGARPGAPRRGWLRPRGPPPRAACRRR